MEDVVEVGQKHTTAKIAKVVERIIVSVYVTCATIAKLYIVRNAVDPTAAMEQLFRDSNTVFCSKCASPILTLIQMIRILNGMMNKKTLLFYSFWVLLEMSNL